MSSQTDRKCHIHLVIREEHSSQPRKKQEEDDDRYSCWHQQTVVVINHAELRNFSSFSLMTVTCQRNKVDSKHDLQQK